MKKTLLFIISLSIIMAVLSMPVNVFTVSGDSGTSGRFNAVGIQKDEYGVKGDITTKSVYIEKHSGIPDQSSGVAAFFACVWNDQEWAQTGYYQGMNHNNTFFASPRYYYEYKIYHNYIFKDLGPAPMGQNHEYGVYLMTQSTDRRGTIILYRDNHILMSIYGFPKESCIVSGQGESHNSKNGMDYHFFNVKYATQGLYWYNFYATLFECTLNGHPVYSTSYPYRIEVFNDHNWVAKRKY